LYLYLFPSEEVPAENGVRRNAAQPDDPTTKTGLCGKIKGVPL